MEKQAFGRLEYIDILKGFAIIFVVMGHVLAGCHDDFMARRQELSQTGNAILMWKYIYTFHMPLFMFVSGLVVFNPNKQYKLVDIGRRLLQYLIPFFCVGTMMYFFFNGGDIMKHLWYLKLLAEFVVMMYVINRLTSIMKLSGHCKTLIDSVLFLLGGVILLKVMNHYGIVNYLLDRGHCHYLYYWFLLGWLVRRTPMLQRLMNSDLFLCLSVAEIFRYIVFGPYCREITVFANIVFYWNLSRIIVNTRYGNYLKKIGKSTLCIYVLHSFFMINIPIVGGFWINTIKNLSSAMTIQTMYALTISLVIIQLCLWSKNFISKSNILSILILGDIKRINNISSSNI